MKTSSIFFGTALMSAGFVFLLNSLDVDVPAFPWILRWWPLLLILLGISLMVKNPAISRINAAVAGVILGLIVSLSAVHPCVDEDDDCVIHIGTYQSG